MKINLGPQVAIIDDNREEVIPLERVLEELKVGFHFFSAKIEEDNYPEAPLRSVELVLLDLYYNHGGFDPEICAQWILSIIGDNQKYNLLVWSKDTHEVDRLNKTLEQVERKPEHVAIWQKTHFDLSNHDFKKDMLDLVSNINSEQIEEEVIKGEIVEVAEDFVLINCLIDQYTPTFQVRRFDIDLLANINNLTIGSFVKIQIFTKPGARLFNFFEDLTDHSATFKQEDIFKGFENSSFFRLTE